MVRVRLTSTRTGAVAWMMGVQVGVDAGAPSRHEGEAGRFTPAEAEALIATYQAELVRAIGRCAWRFELVPVV